MTTLRACLGLNGALLLAVLCFSAPPAHAQDTTRATPPPGKALVFVYRSDRQPIATPVPVTVNAEDVGELTNGSFLSVTVDPGKTFLRSGDRVLTMLRLDTEADATYFVKIEVVHGLTLVQTDMRLVSETEGRRALAEGGVAPPPIAVATAPTPAAPPTPKAVAPPPVVAAPAAIVAAPAPAQPQVIAAVPLAAPAPSPAAPSPPPVVAQAQSLPAPPPAAPPPQKAVVPAVVAAAPLQPAPPPPPPPAPPRRQPPKPKPVPPKETDASVAGWEIALIPKLGTFKMANTSQVVGTLPGTFDSSSKSVFSLEAEWRDKKSGFALGGEIFLYKNQLSSLNGATTLSSQQQMFVGTINGKYYFSTGVGLHPFVGGGIGFASATYSGDLSGNSSGLALQGLAGLEYRFEHVGIYAEYKYLMATTGSTEKVKVGGSGILAGISILF